MLFSGKELGSLIGTDTRWIAGSLRGVVKATCVAILGTAIAFGSVHNASADVSFEDRTVKIIVNFSAGGSTDLFARILAPFVARHLPGEPSIIVENKPGAGGILAATYMFNSSQPNGEEVCLCNSTPTRWATVQDFEFDIREYAIIGSLANNTVVAINSDIGVDKVHDLPSVADRLILGVVSPADINANRLKLFMRAIGADLTIVGGYRGAARSTAAALSGETTVATMTDQYYMAQKNNFDEAGNMVLIGQVGAPDESGNFVPDDRFDVETWDAMWQSMEPEKVDTPEYRTFQAFNLAAGVQFFFPMAPGTDEEVRQAWEDAFAAALVDPEYIAQVDAAGGGAKTFQGEAETRDALNLIYDGFRSPESITVLRENSPVYFRN